MKPPESVLRDLVLQWVAKANLDYRAAERLVQDPKPIREVIAFHCQQAAGKYVKALLVARQVELHSPELMPGDEKTAFSLARRTRDAVMPEIDRLLPAG